MADINYTVLNDVQKLLHDNGDGTYSEAIYVVGGSLGGTSNPSTAAISSVSVSTTSATLSASSSARKGLTIYNGASGALYVAFAATATTSAYTVQVAAGGYYEVPFGYTGAVSGILASGTGSALVTTITA
jgi:hypothetical protein